MAVPTMRDRILGLTVGLRTEDPQVIANVLGLDPVDVERVFADPSYVPSSGGSGSPDGDVGGPIPAPLIGPTDDTPLDHVWSADDLASSGSWYGAELVFLATWTPTVDGTVVLSPPVWDGSTGSSSEVDYYVFEGAPGDVPDLAGLRTTPSSIADAYWYYNTTQHLVLSSADSFPVVAGQPYTLAVVNYDALTAVGRTVALREWCLSVQPFGGAPQRFSWLPTAPGALSHAEGYATVAGGSFTHAEGFSTHAEGASTHAEGFSTHAEGASTHAEGFSTHAEGYFTHAEGDFTHAEGDSTHAEGFATHAEGKSTHAEGDFTHAEGISTHAARVGEHAESSGRFTDQSPTQSSNLTLAAETTDATPTVLVAGLDFVPTLDLPLTNTTLSTVTGRVGARNADGTLAAAWQIEAVIDRDSSTSRIVGVPTVTLIAQDAGAAAWALAITASADGAAITVTGEAATDIRWVAYVEIVEVRFGQI